MTENYKILKNNNISYIYDKEFFINKLDNLEIDMNLNELIYNIHFFPYNIDKWLSREICRYINPNICFKIKSNNIFYFNNIKISDDMLSLQNIRDLLFNNLDKNLCIYSKNNSFSYVFKYENFRIEIKNEIHNENKIILNDKCYYLTQNINKHYLLHFILNPFWSYNIKNYQENKTNFNKKNNDIIIYKSNNKEIIIKKENCLPLTLDFYNTNFENMFIKKIVNFFFNKKPFDFLKFNNTIMTILENNDVEKDMKKILWSNLNEIYSLLDKKNIINIKNNLTESDIILNNDKSIYNLDEKLIKKVKLMNINGNDLFIIIPYICDNNYLIDILPYFLTKKRELPYNSIREKIIHSFFDSNYNGKNFISSYGYKYILDNVNTKINSLKYNHNFLINTDMYLLSKEIENNTNNELDIFIILSNNDDNLFTNKKLNDILNTNYNLKVKSLFIINVFRNKIESHNLSLLDFFNDYFFLFSDKLKINKMSCHHKKIILDINEEKYNILNIYDIITNFLTNNYIKYKNDMLVHNNFIKLDFNEFINNNIKNAEYILNDKKILIKNIEWVCSYKNLFNLIIKNNKVIYFTNCVKFIITFNENSYMYKNNTIYFKKLDNNDNTYIYIETKYSLQYLYWLLCIT